MKTIIPAAAGDLIHIFGGAGRSEDGEPMFNPVEPLAVIAYAVYIEEKIGRAHV